ncbi:DUF2306 domain-containing protein [Hyphomonas sp. BRH_c22]|uniref:DUF2306 domain-containing protein n=1 Tax=Hyphomonas sp. BRH_c22 TaxID=1629710 RepID=UPI000A7C8BE3|nr:DUF2306 domain-containing protein [Hyphomonas sp. BRH_c22]
MTDSAATTRSRPLIDPRKALSFAGAVWFVTAAIGQLAFVLYIAAFYYVSTFQGDFARMDSRVIHGFINGDLLGNALFLSHVLLAFWITASGPMQFIPQVRNRFRTFHRWNGRFYLTVALLTSSGALMLTYLRPHFGSPALLFVNTADGVLIIAFGCLALRAALKRRFDDHRRWALRMFIAVSGVWFFRLGYGFYFFITAGEMPGSHNLSGPADIAVASTWIFALAGLEFYLLAQRRRSGAIKLVAAAMAIAAAGAVLVSSYFAAHMFWLPTLAA